MNAQPAPPRSCNKTDHVTCRLREQLRDAESNASETKQQASKLIATLQSELHKIVENQVSQTSASTNVYVARARTRDCRD